MSASAAPVAMAAAPAQYVYASPPGFPQPQGAGVPMEPVAGGQQMVAGAQQVTYAGMSIGASGAFAQAGGQVTYGAPQVISQGQSVSVAQPQELMQPFSWNADTVPQHLIQQGAAQSVTYVTQSGQEVQTAPAQYITAAPQYVTPAQPQLVQEAAGAVTYASPPTQSYATQGSTAQYVLPSAPSMVAYPGAPMTYYPMSVQQAWDNHVSAFEAKDADKIMLDYDETSVVRVFTSTTGQLAEYRGTMMIRGFFAGVFQELADMSTLTTPVQIVEDDYKQVFFVWTCASSGVNLATDTFFFGHDHKIKRENLVLNKQAGFVAQAISHSQSSGRMGAGASPTGSGRMGAAAAGMAGAAGAAAAQAPGQGVSSAKASKKKDKKDSKKKLGSKKKAKGGFC